jgi:hypothetical protein
MEGKITSTCIATSVLGVSMLELMAKEHQKHEEVRGWLGGIMGREKTSSEKPRFLLCNHN